MEPFIIAEDKDAAHGMGRDSYVRKWKDEKGLSYYFNERGSPDLALKDNCWMPLKANARRHPHWDDQTVRGLCIDRWDHTQPR